MNWMFWRPPAKNGSAVLAEADMPSMFRATDAAAKRGRSSTFWRAGVYLSLLVGAAIGSAINWESPSGSVDFGAALASIALLLALILALWTQSRRPEAQWYAGRAGAESVKSLTWLYCSHGIPFTGEASDMDALFVARLTSIKNELKDLEWPASSGAQITQRMRSLRADDWTTRANTYRYGRVQDQLEWYSRKAEFNAKRETWLSWGAAAITFGGMIVAVLQIMNVFDFDGVGIAAAAAAALTAWAQAQQHRTLASAYALASQELSLVQAQMQEIKESDWAQAVSDAEEAISREHTMWLARRGFGNASN